MSLKAWRAALDGALTNGLGLPVYPWTAASVDPPCAIIEPGDPYLSIVDDEYASFGSHAVRWVVWLIVRATDDDSYDQLDDLIDGIGEALRGFTSPEAGPRPAVEAVQAPTPAEIGGNRYLVTQVTISTLRPST